ncbi:MAG: Maf family nucleotide pyrophosphatase [Cytophagales bacterium]|nr:Maf family nucleotide pyrophosphatase [Cytophagales bacterium]
MKLPKIILASSSPRRKKILEDAGISFEIYPSNILEVYPDDLAIENIPSYLAEKKAEAVKSKFKNAIVLSADTIVAFNNEIMEKPINGKEAARMLQTLSGQTHQVITGVSIVYKNESISFTDITLVTFKELSSEEIDYYVNHYQPFDKAGAYGIQEWLGLIGVQSISGSYFNVMGLPIHRVYSELTKLSTKA